MVQMKNKVWKDPLHDIISPDSRVNKTDSCGPGLDGFLTGEIVTNVGGSYLSILTSEPFMIVEERVPAQVPCKDYPTEYNTEILEN